MSAPIPKNVQSDVIDKAKSVSIRELKVISLQGWIVLIAGSLLLRYGYRWIAVVQWFMQAGLIWWFVINQTRLRLDLNRMNPETSPYPGLGWGNRLTILRGLLIAAVAGFLFQHSPVSFITWLPGILYFFAAAIDRVDGYAARRTAQTSLLGVELDTVVDALGIAVVSLLAVGHGQIHWSYLLLGSAYYLFKFGVSRRSKLGLPVFQLAPGINRRAWAGFQMGFLVVVLFPLFEPPVTTVAGIAFMLPALTGFIIDWLIVSGQINRQVTRVDQCFSRLQRFSLSVLQPGLRVTIVVMIGYLVSQSDFTLLPTEDSSWYQMLFSYSLILAIIMLLAGVAGRIATLVLIGLLGWYYMTEPLDLIGCLLIFSVIWSMLLGTGRFSLWQGDSDWVNRYDGA